MATLAQQLSQKARENIMRKQQVQDTIQKMKKKTIEQIQMDDCAWMKDYNEVCVDIKMSLPNELVEYSDFAYYFSPMYLHVLADLFVPDGFSLRRIDMVTKESCQITLCVL